MVTDSAAEDIRSQTVEEMLYRVYANRGLEPLWVDLTGPNSRASALLEVLKSAHLEGLEPSDYRLTALTALWSTPSIEGKARLEVLLSQALTRYLIDLHRGRSRFLQYAGDPDHPPNQHFREERDLGELIHRGLTAADLRGFLQDQVPRHQAYTGLKKALADYREIAAIGGWSPIAEGPVLHPGQRDRRVASIARRLILSGDLASELPVSVTTYESPLTEAVQRFQQRRNLPATGLVDGKTISAMNLPVEEIITRILVNLERWRWLPRTMNGTRILVNIAEFELTVLHDEEPQISMPVIVGDTSNATPIFSDQVRYIVFNPYWTIPPGIAERETLPRQIADPAYLRSKNIRVYENWQESAQELDPDIVNWEALGSGIRNFRLRQDPGPDNALGRIKFMFPNSQNIYLHDTPKHDLFSASTRTFSHGCIRLSDPVSLAAYLLRDNRPSFDGPDVEKVIASGRHRVVHLDTPVPVHLVYQTVEADPHSGQLQFHQDVYNRDRELAEALFSGRNPALMATAAR